MFGFLFGNVFSLTYWLQDFTGVPAVVDPACMRDAMNKLGGDSNKINPLVYRMFKFHLFFTFN